MCVPYPRCGCDPGWLPRQPVLRPAPAAPLPGQLRLPGPGHLGGGADEDGMGQLLPHHTVLGAGAHGCLAGWLAAVALLWLVHGVVGWWLSLFLAGAAARWSLFLAGVVVVVTLVWLGWLGGGVHSFWLVRLGGGGHSFWLVRLRDGYSFCLVWW